MSIICPRAVPGCAAPHAGVLCGACAAGHRLRGHSCERCAGGAARFREDFGLPLPALAALAALAAGAALLLAWALRARLARLKREVYTNAKIVLGLAQVRRPRWALRRGPIFCTI